MSAFRAALTDLIITAVAVHGDPEEVSACREAVLAEMPAASSGELLPALRRLAEAIQLAPLARSGMLARTVVDVVAAGGPPGAALGALLERLEEALEPATLDTAAEPLAWATLDLLRRDEPLGRDRARDRADLMARLRAVREGREWAGQLLDLLDAGD
jgi:hypothetical protein